MSFSITNKETYSNEKASFFKKQNKNSLYLGINNNLTTKFLLLVLLLEVRKYFL